MIASAPQKMRSPEMKAILRCTSSSPAPNRRLCESAAQVLRGGGEAVRRRTKVELLLQLVDIDLRG